VVNPYATSIHLPPDVHDRIRLHDLFLRLIDQITILHQYQREKDSRGRLIATPEDVRLATRTMFDAIVIKADDLPDKVRRTFEMMKAYIKEKGGENYENYKFRVREIRLELNISKSTLANHINYLREAEYIQHVGGNDHRGNWYKIAWWDDYQAMRERIKSYLYRQIEEIEKNENK
jgi:hypothetical protein